MSCCFVGLANSLLGTCQVVRSSRLTPGCAAELKWAYVPAVDLLLCVGEGLVGVSAEGICLQKKPFGAPTQLLTFAAALRRQRKGSEKRG
eukprot:3539631-Amphidinium_carterae.2